jgi:hypothetical protein
MQLTNFIKTRPHAGMSTMVHVHMWQTCLWDDRHA